jgi:hypothetical protein
MKKSRLLLALAASLLTAAPASAWHRCRYGAAAVPMVPMMPMTGMGMGFFPMPITGAGLGVLPTGGAASGFSMSLSMSGDLSLAMLAPGLLRNLVGTFLGVPGAAGMTEAQVAAVGRQIVTSLLNDPQARAMSDNLRSMNGQLQTMSNQLQTMNELLARALGDRGVFTRPGTPRPGAAPSGTNPMGASPSSPELERARAAVRRLAAGPGAPSAGRATPADLERARAAVRRLAAGGTGPTDGRVAAADLERAREAVRRLAAGEAPPQAGRVRPAANAVASGAK